MRGKFVIYILLSFLFLLTTPLYAEETPSTSSNSSPDYIHTLLVKLKPDLTDEEVKNIASQYGCKIGHIYRFSYDKPHITVKFFVQDKDKTSLDILFDMEDDDRIISVTLDMPGQPQSAYADQIREDLLTANTPMLEAIGWFKADEYYNQKLGQSDGVNTIIVQIGNGVDYKNYPWLKDYLYKLRGKIIGWDVVEEDAIPLDNDPEAKFRDKHETIGAQMMSTLSPHSKILPIRTYKSSRNDASFINMQIGLEQAIESIEFNEMVDQKDYNVVVNIPVGYWLNSPGTRMKLRRFWRHNNEELLPRFQEQYEEELKKAGYTPNNISYEGINQDDKLEDMAFRWLFDAIMEGTLSPKLNPPEGEGLWSSLSTMKEEGWIIVAGGGNYNVSKAYPAAKEEVEGVDQASIEEYGVYVPLNHSWVDIIAPNKFYVYNPEANKFQNLGGSSTSAFIATALYARIWNIAPNLEHKELNRIVKGTATIYDPTLDYKKDKKFISFYPAIKTAWIYGKIKYYVNKYGQDDNVIQTVKNMLEDIHYTKDFNDAELNILEDIVTVSSLEVESLPSFLDTLISKVNQVEREDNPTAYAFNLEDSKRVAGATTSSSPSNSLSLNNNPSYGRLTPSISVDYGFYNTIF